MAHDEWTKITKEEYNGALGFSCTPGCKSRGRVPCDCNFCQVFDMMFSLACPFCAATCGATPDEAGQQVVKNWLGKHLALQHRDTMELYLKGKATKNIKAVKTDKYGWEDSYAL